MTKISDGDTIKVSFNDEEVKVRLLEVDTFEVYNSKSMDADIRQFNLSKNQLKDLGKTGSDFTKSLIHKGDLIFLSFSGKRTGYYGRMLAFVHLADGRVLNEELIKSGAALVYRSRSGRTPFHSEYLQLEQTARNQSRGVWANDQVQRYYNR